MLDMVEFKKLAKTIIVIERATVDAAGAGHSIPWFAVELWLFALGVSIQGASVVRQLMADSPIVRFSEDGSELVLRRKLIEVV